MCNRGLADRVVNFSNEYTLELMREPTNKHDPRAIKVIIGQLDSLLVDQVSLQGAGEMNLFEFGYVPKDIAFSLSTILDSPHIFKAPELSYHKPTNKLTVKFELREEIMRDERLEGEGQCYVLQNV